LLLTLPQVHLDGMFLRPDLVSFQLSTDRNRHF